MLFGPVAFFRSMAFSGTDFWGWVVIAFFLITIAESLLCCIVNRNAITQRVTSKGVSEGEKQGQTERPPAERPPAQRPPIAAPRNHDLDGIQLTPYSPLTGSKPPPIPPPLPRRHESDDDVL